MEINEKFHDYYMEEFEKMTLDAMKKFDVGLSGLIDVLGYIYSTSFIQPIENFGEEVERAVIEYFKTETERGEKLIQGFFRMKREENESNNEQKA